MQYLAIFSVLGRLLMLFSVSMIGPIFVALYYADGDKLAFVFGFLLTLILGFALWIRGRTFNKLIKPQDSLLIVALFWLIASLLGAVPLFMTQAIIEHNTHFFTDALFESVSGLTTTGATILSGLDQLPHALRFYRQELQFLGGLSIMIVAVTLLPIIDLGRIELYGINKPELVKINKLTPRIAETVNILLLIYIGLTVACATAYWLAGMNLFDAVGHAFSTVSTGGFSTHDHSLSYFNNTDINKIAIIFMLLGATNFGLHFMALRQVNLIYYWRNSEFRYYIIGTVLLSVAAIVSILSTSPDGSHLNQLINNAVFAVVSCVTTTGFFTTTYQLWPPVLVSLLMLVMLIGACSGSTAGGAKIVRFLLLIKQSICEMKRLLHPHAIYTIKFDKQILSTRNNEAIWGFIAAYLIIAVSITLLLMTSGLDLTAAISISSATLSNTGLALGSSLNSTNYHELTTLAKWICIFAMLVGRLEIFPLLVVFIPRFWRN